MLRRLRGWSGASWLVLEWGKVKSEIRVSDDKDVRGAWHETSPTIDSPTGRAHQLIISFFFHQPQQQGGRGASCVCSTHQSPVTSHRSHTLLYSFSTIGTQFHAVCRFIQRRWWWWWPPASLHDGPLHRPQRPSGAADSLLPCHIVSRFVIVHR